MANLKCFALLDSKVQAFASPFFMRTTGEALRGFEEVANDPNTTVCRHPEDFALMELGEFDVSTGALKSYAAPVNLGLAAQFKRQPAAVDSLPLPFGKTQSSNAQGAV